MPQGIIVNGLPVPSYKSADEQQQSALGLMEIGYHPIDEPEVEAGDNYNAGANL